EASQHRLEAFGYTVANRHIGAVLWQALRRCGRIELACPARGLEAQPGGACAPLCIAAGGGAVRAVRGSLVGAADGAQSVIKQAAGIGSSERDYGQVALVTNLRTDRPARGIAYERFAAAGPMALLPLASGHYTVVWTVEPARAEPLQ